MRNVITSEDVPLGGVLEVLRGTIITPSAREHEKYQAHYLSNAKARSSELAASVTAMLKDFAKQYPLAKVRTFDTYSYSQTQVAKAAAEGINVSDPCYDPPFMGLPGPVCAASTGPTAPNANAACQPKAAAILPLTTIEMLEPMPNAAV